MIGRYEDFDDYRDIIFQRHFGFEHIHYDLDGIARAVGNWRYDPMIGEAGWGTDVDLESQEFLSLTAQYRWVYLYQLKGTKHLYRTRSGFEHEAIECDPNDTFIRDASDMVERDVIGEKVDLRPWLRSDELLQVARWGKGSGLIMMDGPQEAVVSYLRQLSPPSIGL